MAFLLDVGGGGAKRRCAIGSCADVRDDTEVEPLETDWPRRVGRECGFGRQRALGHISCAVDSAECNNLLMKGKF